jgi:hypothetical protein
MMMAQQLERRSTDLARADEMSIDSVVAQVHKVQELMRLVMREGEHYGTIPGTDKPTLLKPGAEKLCLTFRLNPDYDVIKEVETPELVSITAKCILIHIPTGQVWATGLGSCNSREKKYRYAWIPQADKPDHDVAEEMKAAGTGGWRRVKGKWVWHLRRENDNAFEYSNTIAKMAAKRALVAAVLNATAASDIFTQDLEEEAAGSTTAPQGASLISPESLDTLRMGQKVLAERAPELWDDKVFMMNVKRRFNVENLADLTKEQFNTIWDGMVAYQDMLDADSEEPVEPDVVEGVQSEGDVRSEDDGGAEPDVAEGA